MTLRLGLVRTAATFVYIKVNDAAQLTVWASPFQEQNYHVPNCQNSKLVVLSTYSYSSFRP